VTRVEPQFGQRRIYYNNFAAHLLNAYNPNMLHPGLPHRWSDDDWRGVIDMVAALGFNVLEFWLVPRLFCREGLESDYGREFARQVDAIIDHAHRRELKVEAICSLATVGSQWRTLCPNVKEEWAELRRLWDAWTRRLAGLDIVGIFPGDPGACSRNGCTAQTYIDKSVEVAAIVKGNLPEAEIELHTWGPPFFGWGILQGPPGWQGEFSQGYQQTAWTFDAGRAEASMRHLLRRLPDLPDPASVAINMGFNADGNPDGEQDARGWAREIARTHRVHSWDFSLTEGENAIVPHYRFERLFQRRRQEREAGCYSGGICFTMTPLLNQLSLYVSARSFLDPDANHRAVAEDFFEKLFGPQGRGLVELLPLFEVVPDWGNYEEIKLTREAYHDGMKRLISLLEDLKGQTRDELPLHPSPEHYRRELLFFARLLADLSGRNPDLDKLRRAYWERVYAIYDLLPDHVDPRPRLATDRLIGHFRTWAEAGRTIGGG